LENNKKKENSVASDLVGYTVKKVVIKFLPQLIAYLSLPVVLIVLAVILFIFFAIILAVGLFTTPTSLLEGRENQVYAKYESHSPTESDFSYLYGEYETVTFDFLPDHNLVIAIDSAMDIVDKDGNIGNINKAVGFNAKNISKIYDAMVEIVTEEEEVCYEEAYTDSEGFIEYDTVCETLLHATIKNRNIKDVYEILGLNDNQIKMIHIYLESLQDLFGGVFGEESEALVSSLESYEPYMDISGFVRPTISTRVTSRFGSRTHPITGKYSFHGGIDIGGVNPGVSGDPVFTVKSGKITASGFSSSMGNYVYLSVPLEEGSSYYITFRYMHLHTINPVIKGGTNVMTGQVLGTMGTTGSSTGVHLHIEANLDHGQYRASPELKKSELITNSGGKGYLDITPFIY